MDLTQSLEAAGIGEGDHLTTDKAFALWCGGGNRIVTWGHKDHGGDSSAVRDQLLSRKVQQVEATSASFASVLEDGSVVTWGDPFRGGRSSRIQGQLRDAQQVHVIAAWGCAFRA